MDRHLSTGDLEAFVAVAEERNFTRAAARLHTTQQQLSAQIKRFERHLGVPLFERTTRHVEPTAAATAMLDDARDLIARANRWVQDTHRLGTGNIGTVTIGYTQTCGYELLPELAVAVRSDAPGIELVAREMYASGIEDHLVRRTIDIGLLRCPEGRPGTVHEQLTCEPLLLAIAAASPLARRRRIALSDVKDRTLAMWPRDLIPGYYDACIRVWEAAGGNLDDIDVTSTGAALWSNIESDRSIGLVVSSFERVRPPGIRLVELSDDTDVGASISWPADSRTLSTDRVIELARRHARASQSALSRPSAD